MKKIEYLIYTKEVEPSMVVQQFKKDNIKCILALDVRSAVYYATGISAQCGEIVAVCVDGSNASRSAFSGMTEAFYRQLPVILITLGNSLDYTMELKDVVLGHYLVKDAKEILNFANYKLPAHIELGEEIIIDTEVESLKLQEALMEAVSEKDYLYFSPRFQTKEKDFMCKCISGGMSRCKDGTLSNVFGASLAQKRRRYNGGVTRGICKMDEQNNLTEVVETKNIIKSIGGAESDGTVLDIESLVSMNMWGLTPAFLDTLEAGFIEFFKKEVPVDPMKAEYLIPTFIGELLAENKMSVKVLRSNDTWYGMTYKEDVVTVKESFEEMLKTEVYKEDLFSDL